MSVVGQRKDFGATGVVGIRAQAEFFELLAHFEAGDAQPAGGFGLIAVREVACLPEEFNFYRIEERTHASPEGTASSDACTQVLS